MVTGERVFRVTVFLNTGGPRDRGEHEGIWIVHEYPTRTTTSTGQAPARPERGRHGALSYATRVARRGGCQPRC